MKRTLIFASFALLFASTTFAQAARPIPTAEELGEGWAEVPDTRPTGGPDYPEAYGWYVGPDGARAVLFASRPHARILDSSWADMAQAIDGDDSGRFPREHFPPNSPPIEWCTDVRRVQSNDDGFPLLATAATACRTADTLLRAEISGTWQGLTGVDASDALVELQVDAQPSADQSTAVPQPPDSLALLLPTREDIPYGLVVSDQGSRTAAQIADGFTAPDDAMERLTEWGWQDNAYRTFTTNSPVRPGEPSFIEVSVHRFASESGASRALPYFAEGRADVLGISEVPVNLLRPDEAAIIARIGNVNEATLYMRERNVLLRVTAQVGDGPPEYVARSIANIAVAKAAELNGPEAANSP